MGTITKEVVVPPDRKITVELPADFPAGQAKITVTAESDPTIPEQTSMRPNGQNCGKNEIAKLRGEGKGKVRMADDFDAPLEDFAEYM